MNINLIFASIVLTTFLVFISQKYFHKKKYFDDVNSRSSHTVKATRNGGLSIFLNLFILSTICYLLNIEIFEYSLIIPISILFVVGLYDDIYNIEYKLKFIFQIIAAKILIDNGFIIDNLHGTFGIFNIDRLSAQLITIFIVLAIVNSINFIDGIDGLAIMICGLFIVLFEFFIETPSPFINLSLIVFSSLIPIFIFNYRKNNKVFLGDAGSLFLGGLISIYTLYILSNDYIIKNEFDINKIIFIFSILAYPIVDITRVVILRVINGKSPFNADNNHIHHFLLKKLKYHYRVVLSIIVTSLSILFMIQIINQ